MQPKDIRAHHRYSLGPNIEAWVHGVMSIPPHGAVSVLYVKGGQVGQGSTIMALPVFARKAIKDLGSMSFEEVCAITNGRK